MLSNEPVRGWNTVKALCEEYPLEIGICLVVIPFGVTLMIPPYVPAGHAFWYWQVFTFVLGLSLTLSSVVLIVGLVHWVRTLVAGLEQLGFWALAGAIGANIYMRSLEGDAGFTSYLLHAFIIIAFIARGAGIRRKSRSRRRHLMLTQELRQEVNKHDRRSR